MKKLTLVLAAVAFTFAVNAQDGKTQKPAQATPVKAVDAKDANTKAHVCTAACKDGKHVYAHGEKGHTCTAACKKETPAKK
jgi:hypothetical protein